ncbi:hypothetical protein TNCV_2007641 [Trichonephila clavipes]|nr:hypothetical protein TNCV_2007641 [Trichonephila clavipes]
MIRDPNMCNYNPTNRALIPKRRPRKNFDTEPPHSYSSGSVEDTFVTGEGTAQIFIEFRLRELDLDIADIAKCEEIQQKHLNIIPKPSCGYHFSGRGSLVIKVTDSWQACHEFEPSAAKDSSCRKSVESSNVFSLV